eukprot:355158-Chlamydomonas_euryale.AAC.4
MHRGKDDHATRFPCCWPNFFMLRVVKLLCVTACALNRSESGRALDGLTAWDSYRSPAEDEQVKWTYQPHQSQATCSERGTAAAFLGRGDAAWKNKQTCRHLLWGRQQRGWVGSWSGLLTTANAQAVA